MSTYNFISPIFHIDYKNEPCTGFECVKLLAEEELVDFRAEMNTLLFCVKGKAILSFSGCDRLFIQRGFVQLMPMFSDAKIKAECDSEFLLLNFRNMESLCDQHVLTALKKESVETCYASKPMSVHKVISSFLMLLVVYQNNGLEHLCLLQSKQRELFMLLQTYYTQQELALFFYPLLRCNQNFKEKVYTNYARVKNVKEFAAILNYGYFDFRKKFFANFGVSAYGWMQEQKMHEALEKLKVTDANLTVLSEELGFSSVSHFSKFFKQRLGVPPGYYRNFLITGGRQV